MRSPHPFIVITCFLASCSPNLDIGTENGGANNAMIAAQPESIDEAFTQVGLAGKAHHEAAIVMINHHSDGFSYIPNNEGVRDDLLYTGSEQQKQVLVRATEYLIACFQAVMYLKSINYSGPSPSSQTLRTSRQPLVLTLAAVGAVLGGIGAIWGARQMSDERIKPVVERTKVATPDETRIMAEVLELPAGATSEEVRNHIENELSFFDRIDAAKEIEQRFTADGNGSTVRPFGAEVNEALANATREGGRIAVNTVVSQNTGALGGQGYATALESAGYIPAAQAAAVDLGVSVLSMATNTPLQPLDVFQDVFIASSSTLRDRAHVLAASIDYTPAAALNLLMNGVGAASAAEVQSAWRTLIDEMLAEFGEDVMVEPATPEGSIRVHIPSRTVIHIMEDSEFALALPTDDEAMDLLVSANGELIAHERVNLQMTGAVSFPVPDATTNNNDRNNGEMDTDGDGVPDSEDNCIDVPNWFQVDSDGDGVGNDCDETACPDFTYDEDNCVEGMEWSRDVVGCIQSMCPTSSQRTYTLSCCCDCWDDKTLTNVLDPCRVGFLLSCSEPPLGD